MNYTLLIIAVILLMLGLERTLALYFTRSLQCQQFIRHHFFLHPNGISLLRIPQGLIAIWIADCGHWDWAILWFAFWMITDLTDGTIARTCDLSTTIGAWLDPFSDKCMSFPALFYLALASSPRVPSPKLPLLWVVIYCTLDVIGQASRLFCQKKAANSFGKVKTAVVTVLISIVALNQLEPLPVEFMRSNFVDTMMIACVILAFLSLYCKVIPNNWYANSLTFLNFLCGILAIAIAWFPAFARAPIRRLMDIPNNFILAFLLIFAGQFFDLFDGRVARKYGSTKRGALFDDIADATSFGLAIGSIIYVSLSHGLVHRPVLGAVTAILYVGCLFYRLYRFMKPTRTLPRGIFQGLPGPAGALLAGSFVIAADLLQHQFHFTWTDWAAAASALIASLLMISDLSYRHFGRNLWPSLPRGIRIFLLILVTVYSCIAIASLDWATSFIGLTALLSVVYALFAFATPAYLEKLFLEQAAEDEEEAKESTPPVDRPAAP